MIKIYINSWLDIVIKMSKRRCEKLNIILKPVGYIRSERKEMLDDNWGGIVSTIELDPQQFNEDAILGLHTFSHIEVIFYFHKVKANKIETGSRHPRNNINWPKIGIFSQRGKNRPNQLGLSCCQIIDIEGLSIKVNGLDAIDGTPVLDIKPYMSEFAPKGNIFQPEWSRELMKKYF